MHWEVLLCSLRSLCELNPRDWDGTRMMFRPWLQFLWSFFLESGLHGGRCMDRNRRPISQVSCLQATGIRQSSQHFVLLDLRLRQIWSWKRSSLDYQLKQLDDWKFPLGLRRMRTGPRENHAHLDTWMKEISLSDWSSYDRHSDSQSKLGVSLRCVSLKYECLYVLDQSGRPWTVNEGPD